MTNKLPPKKRSFPIGKDDYKKVIDDNCVYIDKTLLIKEFWETGEEVALVARPRRFGKSITLSMLKYFFEKTEKPTAYLFENSKIWQEEGFKTLQGTFPVIHISFKDIKASTWEAAYSKLKNLLADEVRRTLKPLESTMAPDYKIKYQALIEKTGDQTEFEESLFFITKVFEEHFAQNTIVLIDEYDSPITHAYVHKFYDKMVEFMRQLLSKTLKGNPHLYKGFMTGVVRTAKDGILSGLNNLKICTMLNKNFSDKFGFTQAEVEELLQMVNRLELKEEVKSWYNGYVIGAEYLHDPKTAHLSASIYNPWSILSYLEDSTFPKTYWANTGNPELLERLIAEADEETQKELELLLEGNSLENKQINQDVILLDLNHKDQEPWSFLFFAGYLSAIKHKFQNNKNYYTLAIPNKEIAELYHKLIINAVGKKFSSKKLEQLLNALITGNLEPVNRLLREFVSGMYSSHDLPHNDLERSLHLFVLGLLASLSDRYVIKSNLESGHGRYDILMKPKNNSDLAAIIELKKGPKKELDKLAEEALAQIREKNYIAQLRDFGYTGKIFCYGVAVYKKHLVAKMEITK